eukprot:3761545-Pyramimonas_sp.AAC.1
MIADRAVEKQASSGSKARDASSCVNCMRSVFSSLGGAALVVGAGTVDGVAGEDMVRSVSMVCPSWR